MNPSTISGINHLPEVEKRAIYTRIVPPVLFERFNLEPQQLIEPDSKYMNLRCPAGSSNTNMSIFHEPDFPDPILYGQIQENLNGQVHILLYVLNDPSSLRFDVDRMPDGSKTNFGVMKRNIEAEIDAMKNGLSPGQVRRGLGILNQAISTFEEFIGYLGHELHFAEPLFYHNAVIFERYGFAYQQGRRKMQRIDEGFSPGGNLWEKLDGSTPFRMPEAADSIRLRSWALHDGILGEPYTNVTMYKRLGEKAGVVTCPDCSW
jgi:hypothetical protein